MWAFLQVSTKAEAVTIWKEKEEDDRSSYCYNNFNAWETSGLLGNFCLK